MPESINWPRRPHSRRRILILLAIIFGAILGCRLAFSYYVDSLWFGSLGYQAVFWKTQGIQWSVFALFAVATFVVIDGAFLALKRAYFVELQTSQTIFIGGQPLKLPVVSVHASGRLLSRSPLAVAGAWPIRRLTLPF